MTGSCQERPAARNPRRLLSVLGVGLLVLLGCQEPASEPEVRTLDYDAIEARLEPRAPRHKTSDRFPNIPLTTQHGEEVHFLDDLVEDRAVVVNFMYTTCTLICPGTTSHMTRLHAALGDAMERDVSFLSITLDPETDTPEVLHRYWQAFGSHPGWLYLTGDYEEIELLRRRLGVYDPDPVIDADKTQHSGILTFGSDVTNRWAALPALSEIFDLEETIRRFTRTSARRSRVAKAAPDEPRVHRGTGVIRELRPESGELVIEHGDIPGLMPAMTMAFTLDDADRLTELAVGQSIAFGVRQDDRSYRIVDLAVREGAEPPTPRPDSRGPPEE